MMRAIAIALLIFAGVVAAWQTRNAMSDDAYITMRIARNAIEGRGMRFNAGDMNVQAATSPLNLLLMLCFSAVLSLLGMSAQSAVELAPFLIAAVALPALGVGIYLLCCTNKRICAFGFVTAVAVMFNPFVLSTVGLETVTFCACLVWSVYCYALRKWRWMGVFLALAFLARHDSLLLIFLLLLATYFDSGTNARKQRISAAIVPIVLIVAPWLLFSALYYHSTIPTTLQSKLAQGGTIYWPGYYYNQIWPRLKDAFYGNDIVAGLFVGVAIAGVLLFLTKSERFGRAVAFLFAYMLLHVAAYSALRLPDYHWYFVPYAVIIFIVCGYTLSSMFGAGKSVEPARSVGFRFALEIPPAILVGVAAIWFSWRNLPKVDSRLEVYKQVAAYIQVNPPKIAAGMMEIGIIGFYAPNVRIFDFSGIATREQIERVRNNDATGWLEDSTSLDKVVLRLEKHPLEPDIDPRFFAQFEQEAIFDPSPTFPHRLQVWRRKVRN